MAETQLQILRDAVDRSWGVPDRGYGWQGLPGPGSGQAALSRAFVQMSEGDLVRTVRLRDGTAGAYRVKVGERLVLLPSPSAAPEMGLLLRSRTRHGGEFAREVWRDWAVAWEEDLSDDELGRLCLSFGVPARRVVAALLDCLLSRGTLGLSGNERRVVGTVVRWLSNPVLGRGALFTSGEPLYRADAARGLGTRVLWEILRVARTVHGLEVQDGVRWGIATALYQMQNDFFVYAWSGVSEGKVAEYRKNLRATFGRRISLRVLLYGLALRTCRGAR